jgi:hypothetical protein
MWRDDETSLVMNSSIYALEIPIFPLAACEFFTSILFQGWRCLKYNKTYKPEKGPDFSRWLEYFFTSPLQILIVSTSFGFATPDSLLGQCRMQAALVLLGYNIEQKAKKVYKRRQSKEQAKQGGQHYHAKSGSFQHILMSVGVADLRLWCISASHRRYTLLSGAFQTYLATGSVANTRNYSSN